MDPEARGPESAKAEHVHRYELVRFGIYFKSFGLHFLDICPECHPRQELCTGCNLPMLRHAIDKCLDPGCNSEPSEPSEPEWSPEARQIRPWVAPITAKPAGRNELWLFEDRSKVFTLRTVMCRLCESLCFGPEFQTMLKSNGECHIYTIPAKNLEERAKEPCMICPLLAQAAYGPSHTKHRTLLYPYRVHEDSEDLVVFRFRKDSQSVYIECLQPPGKTPPESR